MTLAAIVRALGGELYAGGRRANIPAPGHSAADRSVSLLLAEGRVVIHSFGAADWREVRAQLAGRGLLDGEGRLRADGVAGPAAPARAEPGRTARRATALALWEAARPLRAHGPAALYCQRRATPEAGERPWAVRSHPAAPVSVYRPGGLVSPALVCAVRGADGSLTAVELTYLTPGGQLRQRLRTPRKAVGVLPAGHAMRLAPLAAELLVAEGVFTTLSAMRRFSLPGWALLSTSNLRRWAPPLGVRRVLIAGDRGADGEASAARLCAELVRRGVAAQVRLPPEGFGDWNDLAQWEARRKDGLGRPDLGEGPLTAGREMLRCPRPPPTRRPPVSAS